MENLLKGIPCVIVCLDDILVTGKNRQEHLVRLEQVLQKLELAGVKIKREKCIFMADKVIYLGHWTNTRGIQPTEEKVQAIKDLPKPTNVKELQAFLGILNYYGRYIPKIPTVLAPLHELLKKDVLRRWEKRQSQAF
jgi:hypothetical protein